MSRKVSGPECRFKVSQGPRSVSVQGRAVRFDSQLGSRQAGRGGRQGWESHWKFFKSLLSDWLDWMRGSEKYSSRVTYIKYKLPPLIPWLEAVMRNISTWLRHVFSSQPSNWQEIGGPPLHLSTHTVIVFLFLGGNTSTSTVFVM